MTKRLGIIGYPIRHSISPVFQQAALDYLALDATYQAWQVEPQSLARFIEGLRTPETLGMNVTVPHKEAVMAYLDLIDDWAETAGAVNTIVNRGGELTGHNTDGSGFVRALEEHGHFSPEGARVLIIGAGGSAKGVAHALARAGVASITIANRTVSRAESLAGTVSRLGLEVGAIPLPPQGGKLVSAAANADLVVNCTTLGMKHGPGESSSPIESKHIPPNALVYDLVYNPPETPLLREARLAGAAAIGGLPMLVYQGAAAFELWTGREAPVDVMLEAARRALSAG